MQTRQQHATVQNVRYDQFLRRFLRHWMVAPKCFRSLRAVPENSVASLCFTLCFANEGWMVGTDNVFGFGWVGGVHIYIWPVSKGETHLEQQRNQSKHTFQTYSYSHNVKHRCCKAAYYCSRGIRIDRQMRCRNMYFVEGLNLYVYFSLSLSLSRFRCTRQRRTQANVNRPRIHNIVFWGGGWAVGGLVYGSQGIPNTTFATPVSATTLDWMIARRRLATQNLYNG